MSSKISRKPLVEEPVKMTFTLVLLVSRPVRKERISPSVLGMRASSCTSSSSIKVGLLSLAISSMRTFMGNSGISVSFFSMPTPKTFMLLISFNAEVGLISLKNFMSA